MYVYVQSSDLYNVILELCIGHGGERIDVFPVFSFALHISLSVLYCVAVSLWLNNVVFPFSSFQIEDFETSISRYSSSLFTQSLKS